MIRLLVLLSFLLSAAALDVRGKIQWSELCPGPRELGPAKVMLDDGKLNAGVTHDGHFLIPDVPVGTYVLSVLSRNHAFDQLRIDVVEQASVPQVTPFIMGTPLDPPTPIPLPYPVTLVARQKYDFFAPRESFNVLAMFQNPMMMMMAIGAVLVLAMPYIVQNLDPDTLQEVQKNRRSKLTDTPRQGDTKPPSESAVEIAKPSQPTGQPNKVRAGKNKRR